MDKWYYFGCRREPGHYVFQPGMISPSYSDKARKLERFDGMLAPQDTQEGYIAVLSRLEGWGMTALSFWDYTVDKRGGCNSTFFAPSLTITDDEILDGAAKHFPEVWARLPELRMRGPNGVLLRRDKTTGEWLPVGDATQSA